MKMVDIRKQHKTRCGMPVIDLHIKEKNEAGFPVTYPVKGMMVVRQNPYKTEYMIWTMEGKADAVWEERLQHLDLVEVA